MGATQLNEQELRNCIYQGAYTVCWKVDLERKLLVCESIENATFENATELILRFLCLHRARAGFVTSQVLVEQEMRENKICCQKKTEMTELFGVKLSVVSSVTAFDRPSTLMGARKAKKLPQKTSAAYSFANTLNPARFPSLCGTLSTARSPKWLKTKMKPNLPWKSRMK